MPSMLSDPMHQALPLLHSCLSDRACAACSSAKLMYAVLMQVFYPFVMLYMIASYLQGGIGTSSMGLLSNVRQWLWIPVFQTAYRCAPHDQSHQ